MKSSTENVKHYFLLYSVPPLLKSKGFPQIFPRDTLYITLVQMAWKLTLKIKIFPNFSSRYFIYYFGPNGLKIDLKIPILRRYIFVIVNS